MKTNSYTKFFDSYFPLTKSILSMDSSGKAFNDAIKKTSLVFIATIPFLLETLQNTIYFVTIAPARYAWKRLFPSALKPSKPSVTLQNKEQVQPQEKTQEERPKQASLVKIPVPAEKSPVVSSQKQAAVETQEKEIKKIEPSYFSQAYTFMKTHKLVVLTATLGLASVCYGILKAISWLNIEVTGINAGVFSKKTPSSTGLRTLSNSMVAKGGRGGLPPLLGPNLNAKGLRGERWDLPPVQGPKFNAKGLRGESWSPPPVQGPNLNAKGLRGERWSPPPLQGPKFDEKGLPGGKGNFPPLQGPKFDAKDFPAEKFFPDPDASTVNKQELCLKELHETPFDSPYRYWSRNRVDRYIRAYQTVEDIRNGLFFTLGRRLFGGELPSPLPSPEKLGILKNICPLEEPAVPPKRSDRPNFEKAFDAFVLLQSTFLFFVAISLALLKDSLTLPLEKRGS